MYKRQVSETALRAVPHEYEEASLALGATEMETSFRVVLPAARSGAPMKNSRQRNAILECVMSHHDHPTADIIYQELRESFPNISLGTVYRNLSLLTSLGKIMKITCENHADRFDGQTIPHAHFQCKSCGCLQDIPFKPSVHPQEDIGEGFDGIISDYTITFRGYCANCAQKS